MITTFVIDPVFHYRMPLFGMEEEVPKPGRTELVYVSGIADKFDYDTAIIGTSLSENFRVSWFDEAFGYDTVKLTTAGGYSKEYTRVLDKVVKHSGTKNIIMNIDISYLLNAPGEGRWSNFPDYLYDDNIWNDMSYLLNKDMIYYDYFLVSNNLKNNHTNYDELYTWGSDNSFGRKKVLDTIPDKMNKMSEEETAIKKYYYIENLKKLESYIQNNPNINFKIFYPPVSIAFWYWRVKIEEMDFYKTMLLKMYSLCEYENVDMYLFFDEEWQEKITNLDNYKDMYHYKKDLNYDMVQSMANGESLITPENREEKISSFIQFCKNYDYLLMFEE